MQALLEPEDEGRFVHEAKPALSERMKTAANHVGEQVQDTLSSAWHNAPWWKTVAYSIRNSPILCGRCQQDKSSFYCKVRLCTGDDAATVFNAAGELAIAGGTDIMADFEICPA